MGVSTIHFPDEGLDGECFEINVLCSIVYNLGAMGFRNLVCFRRVLTVWLGKVHS
jgi:hypothetical protein